MKKDKSFNLTLAHEMYDEVDPENLIAFRGAVKAIQNDLLGYSEDEIIAFMTVFVENDVKRRRCRND